MKAYRLCSTVGIAALGTLFANPAQADETARGSFGIRAVIPAYCEIESNPIVLDQGEGYQSGSVMEICNMTDGFQVAASYRELAPSERVHFNYAGISRQLSPSGWTSVANRIGAKFGRRPIAVDYASLEAPLAINLTITYF